MKIAKKLSLLLMMCLSSIVFADDVIKVACVGDSITFGATIPNRNKLSYPAQLQFLLGDKYQVTNYGRNGATMLKQGNYPYWNTGLLEKAVKSNPDLVFIKLGTNDSKMVNWKHKGEFVKNYKEMVSKFKACESKPRIVLILPVPAFTEGEQISGSRVLKEVIPKVQQVAYDEVLEVLDMHSPLTDKQNFMHRDKIHPNPFGAHAIAWRIFELLNSKTYSNCQTASLLTKSGIKYKTKNFYGYPCYEFKYNGRSCKLVAPKRPTKGFPWVWRARFWGHEPQFDISMLERGFHVAYSDVAGFFGNFEAVANWDRFYKLTQELKLNSKVVLEGMSRGGLIIYNWAALNPKKVAAIYADNPVCDFRSWPGGAGAGSGAPREYENCLKRYRLDEIGAKNYKKMPFDTLAPLAAQNVPILHVCGLADRVVPFSENSKILIDRYKELKGKVKLIEKPRAGHHPHSLKNPMPITRFVLEATGRWISDSVVSAPAAEFRGGPAGWGGGTWWTQLEKINKIVKDNAGKVDLAFFGDSITQNWTGPNERLAVKDGNRAIDRYFGMYTTVGMGISGDRTEHLLFRLENGNFDGIEPKAIVLMIGVNNLLSGEDSPEEIASGITLIVNKLLKKLPKTTVILHGAFPAAANAEDANRLAVDRIHELISPLDRNDRVKYIDLRSKFILPNGSLNSKYYRGDHIHLKGPAYDLWAESIKPLVDQLITGKKPVQKKPEPITEKEEK